MILMKFFLGALYMFSLFKHTDYRKKSYFLFSRKIFLGRQYNYYSLTCFFFYIHRCFSGGPQHLRKKKIILIRIATVYQQ